MHCLLQYMLTDASRSDSTSQDNEELFDAWMDLLMPWPDVMHLSCMG